MNELCCRPWKRNLTDFNCKHLPLLPPTASDDLVPHNNTNHENVSASRSLDFKLLWSYVKQRFSPDWRPRLHPLPRCLLPLPAATLSERGRLPVPASTAQTADTGAPRLSPGLRGDTRTHPPNLTTEERQSKWYSMFYMQGRLQMGV